MRSARRVKKIATLFVMFIFLFSLMSCEVLQLKYYANIQITNNGNDSHQVGFGESASSIVVEFENLYSGDSSESSVIEADRFRIFEKITGSWIDISSGIYSDGFSFSKGKSYEFKLSPGTPDTYFIVEL